MERDYRIDLIDLISKYSKNVPISIDGVFFRSIRLI